MEDMIREYLSIEAIKKLTTQGIDVTYTGWRENNGIEYLYEVRYRPIQQEKARLHTCMIFDLVKIDDEKYRCQTCNKIHDQISFEAIKNATPIRYCHCGGISKQMRLHIPTPLSGYVTKPVFYICHSCAGKYMYYRFACDTENCGNYCDITEVYCLQCRKKK